MASKTLSDFGQNTTLVLRLKHSITDFSNILKIYMTLLSLRCYLIGVNLILYTGKGIFSRVLILSFTQDKDPENSRSRKSLLRRLR